jgi:hypothetical protein
MSDVAILFDAMSKPSSAPEAWLARAARIRRIAMLLPVKDAQVLKTYAAECEAEAQHMIGARSLKVAA